MGALLNMSTRIRLRRDTAANWTSNNPTLTTGEMGYETDTGKFKIGNNTNAWTALPYSITAELSEGNLNDLKDVTITSAANGDFLRWNGTAWVNDAVNLSTDTVGSFVESLVAGTGVTLTNNSGEAATPTIAIGQAVATNSNVTFNDVTVSGNLTVSGTTTSINTSTLNIADNIVILNNDVTGAPSENAGIEVERGTSANVALRWNETEDKWEITTDGSAYATIATTSDISSAQATTNSALDLKANLANPTFTGTVILPDNTVALGAKTTGDYVTSLVAGTGITLTNNSGESATPTVTVDTAVIQARVADVSDTEIGYLNGVTSAIQTQLDAKAALASPTFTGTVTIPTGASITAPTGLVKGDVGLGSVDNTSDTNKPVSTAQQTALDLKANLASPALTGTPTAPTASSVTNSTQIATTAFVQDLVSSATAANTVELGTDTTGNYVSSLVAGTGVTLTNNSGESATPTIAIGQAVATNSNVTFNDLTVSGNLTVSGTTTSINTETLTVDDNIIVLNNNATGAPSQDAGIEVERGSSTNVALRWNETSDKWEATNDGSTYGNLVTTADSLTVSAGMIADVVTNAQTASYTLVLDDKNKIVEMNVASANNLTVPPNSSVAFPVGSQINILQVGAGQTTVVAGAGVTINSTPGLKIRAQYSYATLIKRATNTWVLVGDISA